MGCNMGTEFHFLLSRIIITIIMTIYDMMMVYATASPITPTIAALFTPV